MDNSRNSQNSHQEMSDNMEQEKNERSAREIEEEEMKRQLTGIGIYEPGITYGEMKQILGFLNASGNTSNVTSDDKNTQQANVPHPDECLSDMKSETDALEEVAQDHSETSRSTYSYKLNRTSPTITYERKIAHYSSSPESPSIFDVQNPVHRHKSPDNDEKPEKQYENCSANRFISLRSSNAPRECQVTAEAKAAQNAGQSEHNQRLDRWRLNPLNTCINENDVPLRQPRRSPVRERMPFGCCKEAHTSEQRDQAVQALSQHLRKMADLWHSWQRPTDMKFQLGSPIQVGTANGSLDRKPLTDPKTEPIKTECTYRDHYSRASKRKANSLIASLNKENSTEDEDDQYEFVSVKKKNIKSEGNSKVRTSQLARVSTHEKTTSCMITSQQHSFNDDDSNINPDEKDNRSLHSESRIGENSERLSPELITYPKRIIPPKPKPRLSLSKSRQKRGNDVTSKPFQKRQRTDRNEDVAERNNQKKSNTISDVEIRQKLEESNDEEESMKTTSRDVEIRPLPLAHDVQSRLQEKLLSSNNTKTTKETVSVSKDIDSDRQWNKEKKTKKLGEQQKKEKKFFKTKNKNVVWEHQLMSSDNEDESPDTNRESNEWNGNRYDNTSANNVNCPICNKLFPHDKIENHAADCEQFEITNEENNETEQLECNICNNYKTNNGNEYEEHVHRCINSKNNKTHSREPEDINVEHDTVSTLSFRTNKPVCEQTESKTKMFNRKRKY